MGKPWSEYQQVIVETYHAVKAGKSSRVDVRPVPGQLSPSTCQGKLTKTNFEPDCASP